MSTLLKKPILSNSIHRLNVEGEIASSEAMVQDRSEPNTIDSHEDEINPHGKVGGSAQSHISPNTETVLRQELDDIKLNLLNLQEDARKKGFTDGFDAGVEIGKQKIDDQINSSKILMDSIAKQYNEKISDHEDMLVEIVYTATCKIVSSLIADKRQICEIVKKTLNQVRTAESMLLRLSPDDYKTITALPNEIISSSLFNNIQLIEDTEISSGGCILQSNSGSLDCQLDVQLQLFRDSLLEVREANKKS